MEVYASGFAEHQGGYFISCENAMGVMTGWRTLMGIPNGRVFSLNAKGFFIEQCSWLSNEDFLRILRQGTRVCAYSARIKVPERVQSSKIRMINQRKIIATQMQELKFHYLLPKFQTSLVQTSQRACSAQTGDEWSQQWRHRGRRGATG
jgi:hypothetical protein